MQRQGNKGWQKVHKIALEFAFLLVVPAPMCKHGTCGLQNKHLMSNSNDSGGIVSKCKCGKHQECNIGQC